MENIQKYAQKTYIKHIKTYGNVSKHTEICQKE